MLPALEWELFHCAERLCCISRLRVDLSMWWSAGREKVTRNAAWAEAAILLALSRFVRVRWAMLEDSRDGPVLPVNPICLNRLVTLHVTCIEPLQPLPSRRCAGTSCNYSDANNYLSLSFYF